MKQTNLTTDFYDQLAEDYHLIFSNWQKTIKRQADILQKLILSCTEVKNPKVLDCSCGIGTQAIALALKGYKVTASDISSAEIRRAKKEAAKRKLDIKFNVADFRRLNEQIPGSFDIIISFDNALPHMLSNSDMKKAIKNIYAKLNRKGFFFASIRDYDKTLKEKPKGEIPNEFNEGGIRRIVFQIWDWQKNNTYKLNHFILKEKSGKWVVKHRVANYRAWRRAELDKILKQVGFQKIHWLMPNKTGLYQPIVIAKKPQG